MEFLNKLHDLRNEPLPENMKLNIVEFGKGFALVGSVYKVIGSTLEVVGKTLQSPESTEEILSCITDFKYLVLSTAINLVTSNEKVFADVEDSINSLMGEDYEENVDVAS